jgi:hypothetical protein
MTKLNIKFSAQKKWRKRKGGWGIPPPHKKFDLYHEDMEVIIWRENSFGEGPGAIQSKITICGGSILG